MHRSASLARGSFAMWGLLALLGAAGCRWEVTVGPLGEDATLSGNWTIEGAPVTAASCNAIGIDEVRLAVLDGASTYFSPLLRANCVAGMIDTRPTAVLSEGNYTVRWEGIRAGSVVATGSSHVVTARFGGHVLVPTVDFVSGPPVFDPIGTDASVEAHWTVNGVAPTFSSCSALGIDRVRIAFFAPGESTPREYTSLTANCEDGAFDTRPERVLRAGTYSLQFQAVNTAGDIIGSGAMATYTVAAGGHLSIYEGAPVNFSGGGFDPHGTDATVSADWLINDLVPNAGRCYAVGISTVRVLLHPVTDTGFVDGEPVAMASCTSGMLNDTVASVRAGTYLVSVDALSADGETIAQFVPSTTPVTIPVGANLDVTMANFEFPLTLAIALDWQRSLGGTPADCATAGVSTMTYTLFDDMTGAPVAMRTGTPCGEAIFFESGVTAGFGAGRYRLYFEGYNAAGTKHWQVGDFMCDGLVVDNTTSVVFDQCLGEYE